MRLFLDTEFEDLAPNAKLISIALVDEDENYFYAELTDTYELKSCSEFVKKYVLPLLLHKNKMTHYECSFAISNWIENRNCPCVIMSDNPSWDIPYLNKLLEPLWPDNLEKRVIPIRVSIEKEQELVNKFNYKVHNALDDALVMKKATLGY